jgi:hypothetical protein
MHTGLGHADEQGDDEKKYELGGGERIRKERYHDSNVGRYLSVRNTQSIYIFSVHASSLRLRRAPTTSRSATANQYYFLARVFAALKTRANAIESTMWKLCPDWSLSIPESMNYVIHLCRSQAYNGVDRYTRS